MIKSLLGLINEHDSHFSKGQKRIGEYIKSHYDKAAFMTASKLGSTVGVSESTVVRFAAELGFDGYPQLQKALQEMIRNKLTSVQRMEVMESQIGSKDVLSKVLNSDVEKIKKTLEQTDTEDFNKAVQSILNAKDIYVIGVRSAASLASFVSLFFILICGNVKLVNSTSESEMFEQLMRINKHDVIIGISFPRYSKRTIKALQYAKENGASVISITDSKYSPITAYSDHSLLAKSDMASFVDSLVAPMSLINALIVAVGLEKKEDIAQTFAKLENIWEDYDVYEKTEEN